MKRLTIFSLLWFMMLSISYAQDNNCLFWYTEYTYMEINSQGEAIESSAREITPSAGTSSLFEVQFEYAESPNTATFPLIVYLNEMNDDNNRISHKAVCIPLRQYSSSVSFSDDAFNLYSMSPHSHLKLKSNGVIIIYEIGSDGKYKSAKYFDPHNASFIYAERYKVMKDKLMRINWGK